MRLGSAKKSPGITSGIDTVRIIWAGVITLEGWSIHGLILISPTCLVLEHATMSAGQVTRARFDIDPLKMYILVEDVVGRQQHEVRELVPLRRVPRAGALEHQPTEPCTRYQYLLLVPSTVMAWR